MAFYAVVSGLNRVTKYTQIWLRLLLCSANDTDICGAGTL